MGIAGPERWRRALTAERLVLVALALLAAGLSLLVQHLLLPLLSKNLDEGVYLFQAHMLREGMVSLPAESHGTFFRPWLSGEADGRIFTEYQVGFPAFLALSDLVLGSARHGLVLVAAASVVTVHGWARALLGDGRTAMVATVLASFSPLAVLHSGLVVTYSLTVLLLTAGGWATLAAVARRSWRMAAGAGLLWGGALLVRPLDALIVMAPMGLLALVRLRRAGLLTLAGTAPLAGAVVAGIVPALGATLAYNTATTGSATSFPNMAADPLNTFGFGTRRLMEGEATVAYGRSEAWTALLDNVGTVPSWTLGGIVVVGLALVGALARGRGAERLVLVAIVLAFPLVYLTWWATVLSGIKALNGIGPHYYVPSFTALAVLAARGAVVALPRLPRPRVALAVVVAAGLVATGWALPDKLADKRQTTTSFRTTEGLVPDDLGHAVVLVDDARPYVLARFPFLQPDPTLTDDVLIGASQGPLDPRILDHFPDREVYRLREELRPGDELLGPSGSFRRLDRVAGVELTVTMEVTTLHPDRQARAVVRVGDRVERVALGPTGADGDLLDPAPALSWTLGPEGPWAVTGPTEVVVGVELSRRGDFTDVEAVEHHLGLDVGPEGELRTMVPGVGWHQVRFGGPDPLRFREDVDRWITATVTPL